MKEDQTRLERFLNGLEGEAISIIPSVSPKFTPGGVGAGVDFVFIVEKTE